MFSRKSLSKSGLIICAFIICARQNKESEKDLLNTNKQKTNTRTCVNQRDDMLTE
jgi:hypothetical protein